MARTLESSLQQLRLRYRIPLPNSLEKAENLIACEEKISLCHDDEIVKSFPCTINAPYLSFKEGIAKENKPLRIAALFSGGQAPGGHNVICGLYDYIKKIHSSSQLFGFKDGPSGLIKNNSIELTKELIDQYRNQGGFEMLSSSRTKIETPDQFKAAAAAVQNLNLDGLLIIGGDDSNTNAAFLAEFFTSQGIETKVIGVPKTIDGDLKNSEIEIPFGFDSATKVYSDLIGNIQRDALSAKKYYHFIRLMGRTASHITLECALRTQPNAALIGEEISSKKKSLSDIVRELSDLISRRSALDKNYGVILIPEGLLEFIPECKKLISELNSLLSKDKSLATEIEAIDDNEKKLSFIKQKLSPIAKECFTILPKEICLQLLKDRDPHGNVQVSQIDSERLLITMVKKELEARKGNGSFKGSFNPLPHFYGYEGRACYPSDFDSNYCYALGQVAGILIKSGANGYLACIKKLAYPIKDWEIFGIPLTSMMAIEERGGKKKPVIVKALVDLNGATFKVFEKNRELWENDDSYLYPGPQQYFGPQELTEIITQTLRLDSTL